MPVYRIIVENGNVIPTKQAFINVSAHFNRYVVKLSSQYKVNHGALQILCCLYVIVQARGKQTPFALTTLSRNYYVPFHRYKRFLAHVHELHRQGLLSLDYVGTVKGSKVAITLLGINVIDQLYKDFEECMQNFPIQG